MTMGSFRRHVAVAYILTQVGVVMLGMLMEHFARTPLPSSMWLVCYVAALGSVGTALGRQISRQPSGGLYWKLAFQGAVIAVFTSCALAAGVLWLSTQAPSGPLAEIVQDEQISAAMQWVQDLPLPVIGAGIGVLLLVHILVGRLILPIFVRGAMKGRARRA